MIIRFEVDACVSTLDEADIEAEPTFLELHSSSSPGLSIILSSHEVPQSSLAELKTTVQQVDYGKVFCQLYFSQTSHLFVDKHPPGDGNFYTIEHHQLGMGNLALREEKLRPNLRRLGQSVVLKTMSACYHKMRYIDSATDWANVALGFFKRL
jgi:hypothetical protein